MKEFVSLLVIGLLVSWTDIWYLFITRTEPALSAMSALGSSVSWTNCEDWLQNWTNSFNVSSAFGFRWSTWNHLVYMSAAQIRWLPQSLLYFYRSPESANRTPDCTQTTSSQKGDNYFSTLMHWAGGCQSSTLKINTQISLSEINLEVIYR